MSLELLRPLDDLALKAMRKLASHFDDDGLVHLVADHSTHANLAAIALVFGYGFGLAHLLSPLAASANSIARMAV